MISLPYRFVYRDEGDEPSEDALEFRLTYEGKLASTRGKPEPGQIEGRAQHKHDIRRVFHKQLDRLWSTNPALRMWRGLDEEHRIPGKRPKLDAIIEAHETPTFRWAPLVTERLYMNCKLDILYLRNGTRGNLLSDADIDNRMKTLVDALKIPQAGEISPDTKPEADEDPFFVLLAKDSLVTHLSVETDVLLQPTDPKLGDIDSRIVIFVKMWPYRGTWDALDLGS